MFPSGVPVPVPECMADAVRPQRDDRHQRAATTWAIPTGHTDDRRRPQQDNGQTVTNCNGLRCTKTTKKRRKTRENDEKMTISAHFLHLYNRGLFQYFPHVRKGTNAALMSGVSPIPQEHTYIRQHYAFIPVEVIPEKGVNLCAKIGRIFRRWTSWRIRVGWGMQNRP